MKPVITAQQAEAPLVLALDIGTSSARAMLFDRLGRALVTPEGRIVEGRQTYQIEIDLEGAFETNADMLLDKIFRTIDEALVSAGPLAEAIGGVCCCTFVSNVLGIDQAGRAVTPLILYGDTRAAVQAAGLSRTLDEAYFHQRTGTRFHSSYLPARLLWWRMEKPEEFNRTSRWISFGEYLLLHLFGSAAASYSVASWTGLLHRTSLTWDQELVDALPVDVEQLSHLVDADYAWSGLREVFARRWPALADVPWYPAVGDGAAANLGSGCASPAQVAISMGTSSAVRTIITDAEVTIPSGLWCYRVDRRRSLLGGAMTEGGSVYSWFCKTLNLQNVGDLESALVKCSQPRTA
jgi:gluconokinase